MSRLSRVHVGAGALVLAMSITLGPAAAWSSLEGLKGSPLLWAHPGAAEPSFKRQEGPVAALEQAALAAMIRFANACGALVASHQGAMGADLELAAIEGLVRGSEG